MGRMVQCKKSVLGKRRAGVKTELHWPIWYSPDALLGSAVRYVASLSPRFNWVGIYILKGKALHLGPFVGAPTERRRISVGRGICGTAILKECDMIVPNVNESDIYLACSLETQSEMVILIRDRKGEICGQIDVDSHVQNAFGAEEERSVREVAQELGKLWIDSEVVK